MTPDEEFAARIIDAINAWFWKGRITQEWADYHAERVASDLAGLLRHLPISEGTPFCSRCCGLASLPWPCEDYADRLKGLDRVGRIYGVLR